MLRPGVQLHSDSEFARAQTVGAHVEVYQQDELLDTSGLIEKFNANVVTVGGVHFLRQNCQFIISAR